MSWKARIALVLIFTMIAITFTYDGFVSNNGGRSFIRDAFAWTTSPLLHNSMNLSTAGWASGWGIPGGKYGTFTCETCHAKTTPNIKRIKQTIQTPDGTTWPRGMTTTAAITFTQANGTNSDMGDATTPFNGVCNACHDNAKHPHYGWGTSDGHNSGVDCTQCHLHSDAFAGKGECIDCHATARGSRAAIVSQFSQNSHHVMTTISNTHCAKCHWEANADGSMNGTYHKSQAGGAVDLIVWNTNARPLTYDTIAGTGRTAIQYWTSGIRAEFTKLNEHCLGCHDDTNKNTDIFADGRKPSYYAWDTQSIDAKYSQTTWATWGKYSWLTMGARKNITKAFSAHGYTTVNQMGWDSLTGFDVAIPDRTGSVDVLCFDCHNSHGSSVSQKTASYSTFGGILKDTTIAPGGYSVSYKPWGTTRGTVGYNAGAAICFDCHMSQNATATPWGWGSTYLADGPIMGYLEKPYWWGSNLTADGYKAGAGIRYTYKNARKTAGSHFGASSPLAFAPTQQIEGICTKCHDPHGVSPTLGADQKYGVPLLKDTYLTSPYREDAAPNWTSMGKGGGRCFTTGFRNTSYPGYHIDQNTFRPPSSWNTALRLDPYKIPNYPWNTVALWGTPSLPGWTSGYSYLGSSYFAWSTQAYDLSAAWATAGQWKVGETEAQFAGLCLNCHSKANINNNATTQAWGSVTRIHNSVSGWAQTTGLNANNQMHAYVCSKCHTPHSSCLPRLMITNCLDARNHRGQVTAGGTVPPQNSTSCTSGGGRGRFPGGGGGWGCSATAGRPNGKFVDPAGAITTFGYYYFGKPGTSTTAWGTLMQCHEGNWTTFTDQRWNLKTQWSSL